MLWSGKDLRVPRNDELVADLDWLGLRRLVFKSDQEPAILALKQAVRESMPTLEFVMEESLVGEHQSNGSIEVKVREIQKQVRVMKSALEERMKCEVPSRHSHPGVSRGARGDFDVKVSSWS